MNVLCINGGSSSLKMALIDEHEKALATANVEDVKDPSAALDQALAKIGNAKVDVIAHRIVHGGPHHFRPALVDDALLADLEKATPLAPLHLPAALATIAAMKKRFPSLPQVVCFDTGFHETMPEVAKRLPLPEKYGVRKYGFHGISYEYVMSTLGTKPPSRVIIAHLGSGASLVAVKDGKSIDTTMGMTPTGGIVMSSRTGDLDPGVLVYLAREHHLPVDAMETLVDREGGLLAVGGNKDMKKLLAARAEDPRAKLAVDVFVYSVKKAIGALATSLGGVDLLVFTGGIGEHATEIREAICHGLDFLRIGAVRVVATNEDVVLARHASRLAAAL